MTGDEQGQQNLPEEPRRPRVIPGVGGKLDPPREEMKELEPKLITSELANLNKTSELKPLEQKQGAKGEKKE